MLNTEIEKYKSLNKLAEQNGTVIFGGNADVDLPLCELKQAFSLDDNFYNRSISDISVCNAAKIYNACVAELNPQTVLLHIGEKDIELFRHDASEFECKFRELIKQIRVGNAKCSIAVISLKNYANDDNISQINKNLKYIAESEQCEYCDISARKVWNPRRTKEVVSFIYTLGLPLANKRPLYDLAKILFCFGV